MQQTGETKCFYCMLNRIMLVTGCGLNEMPVNFFGRVVAETVLIVANGPIFME